MFKHILIPTDGSSVAAKAVKAGIALAKEHGARVTGFHAAEPVPQRLYGEGYVVDKEMAKEFERRQLEASQQALVGKIEAPSYELPRLPEGVDLGGLYELAALLKKQGLA